MSSATPTPTPIPSTWPVPPPAPHPLPPMDSSEWIDMNGSDASGIVQTEKISPLSATALGLESAILLGIVIYLLLKRWVSIKTVRYYSIVLVIMGWFFSFYIIFLIPMDMSATTYQNCLLDPVLSTLNLTDASLPLSLTGKSQRFSGDLVIVLPSVPEAGSQIELLAYESYTTKFDDLFVFVAPDCFIETTRTYNKTNLFINVATGTVSKCDAKYSLEAWLAAPEDTYGDLWNINGTLSGESLQYRNLPGSCHRPALYMSQDHRLILWNIIYWFTYFMCWLGFPLVQSYATAGDFHRLERIRTSLKENILFYLVAGYGLVEVPRQLWRQANKEVALKFCAFNAIRLRDDLKEAQDNLRKTMQQIRTIDATLNRADPYRKFLAVILSKCPPEYKDIVEGGDSEPDMHYKALTKLNYQIMQGVMLEKRAAVLYAENLKQAFELEDILASAAAPEKRVRWTFSNPREGSFAFLDGVAWFWHTKISSIFWRCAAVLGVLLSLTIIYSETVINDYLVKFSFFYYMFHGRQINEFGLQLLVFIPIGWMALCGTYTLFSLRIANYYRLLPYQQTDENSILFASALITRLVAPLAINWMLMCGFTNTAFLNLLPTGNQPELHKFYDNLNYYFPAILVCFCALVALNVWTRLISCCSCCCKKQFHFSESWNDDQVDEGRSLLRSERRKWETKNRESGLELGTAGLLAKDPAAPRKSIFSASNRFRRNDDDDL